MWWESKNSRYLPRFGETWNFLNGLQTICTIWAIVLNLWNIYLAQIFDLFFFYFYMETQNERLYPYLFYTPLFTVRERHNTPE